MVGLRFLLLDRIHCNNTYILLSILGSLFYFMGGIGWGVNGCKSPPPSETPWVGTCDPTFLRFPVIKGYIGVGLGLIFKDFAPIDDHMGGLISDPI